MTVSSILEAADRILRTDGYEAASTNRVARVAGFSVGSLYQYFRDKQAIVGALIDRELVAEAELVRDLLERGVASTPHDIAARAFGEVLLRRLARSHLYRTLDEHAGELGAAPILDQFASAQSAVLSDTLQRVAAQVFPRSPRSIDARVFVLSRVALSVSFAMAVDVPTSFGADELRAEFADAVDRFLGGKPPGPSAATLVLGWAKPPGAAASAAEQRSRKRREARGVLLAAGVLAAQLEPRVFLLASVADVAQITATPRYGMTQEDLLHEVARFAEALGA